jgi:hypothetical protein
LRKIELSNPQSRIRHECRIGCKRRAKREAYRMAKVAGDKASNMKNAGDLDPRP